jgi:hypothetical protein
MCAGLVIVAAIARHDSAQMRRANHDHMVDHSRRTEPINRSTYAFCQGQRGRSARMPKPRRRRFTTAP